MRKIEKINATKINAAKQRAERYEKKRQAKQRRKETHKEAAIAALVGREGARGDGERIRMRMV